MAENLILPRSLDAEEAVLGAMFISRDAVDNALGALTAADFYLGPHRVVFQAMGNLSRKGDPVDLVTVTNDLEPNLIEKAGGSGKLISLSTYSPSAADVDSFIRIVKEKSHQRQAVTAFLKAVQDLQNGSSLDEVQASVIHLFDSVEPDGFKHIIEIVDKAQAASMELGRGLKTGFEDLDALTGGFRSQDLVILAARPSMGKTSLALRIARNVASRGETVAFVSLESSAISLAERLAFQEAEIDSHEYYGNYQTDADKSRLNRAFKTLASLPIHIDETVVQTVDQIHSRGRRIKARHGLGLLVVDYLGLIIGERGASRYEVTSDISRGMKEIAQDLDVPILLLSQLSRAVESRPKRIPQLSDLRDSGSIEQDADLVLFLYRPAFYGFSLDENGYPIDSTSAQLEVAKNRNGRRGRVHLHFQPEYTLFSSDS